MYKLNTCYKSDDIHMFLNNSYIQFIIPTEFIVGCIGDMSVIPYMGRDYFTNLYLYKNEIVDWKDVNSIYLGEKKQIVLRECYSDNGNDGHVEMVLVGWEFVVRGTSVEFEKYWL